jgi:hypothetical protein
MTENELDLRLLYFGHDGAEIVILTGALDSAEIPYIPKREFGLQSHAPAVFYSPGTEVKIYVSGEDWESAVDLARTVLGESWAEPKDE